MSLHRSWRQTDIVAHDAIQKDQHHNRKNNVLMYLFRNHKK